jgi:hypothetical protein
MSRLPSSTRSRVVTGMARWWPLVAWRLISRVRRAWPGSGPDGVLAVGGDHELVAGDQGDGPVSGAGRRRRECRCGCDSGVVGGAACAAGATSTAPATIPATNERLILTGASLDAGTRRAGVSRDGLARKRTDAGTPMLALAFETVNDTFQYLACLSDVVMAWSLCPCGRLV